MNETELKLKDFINETCKDPNSDLDLAICLLQQAIKGIEACQENRKRKALIRNFKEAHRALLDADIGIWANAEPEMLTEHDNSYDIDFGLEELNWGFYNTKTGVVIKND